ncbi:MAG: hypothetical protein U0Z17_11375 [Bacteroidales bacterium]
MDKSRVLILMFLIICGCCSAQKKEFVTVKAGTRLLDVVPYAERYRFPGFIKGKVYYKSGTFSDARLNYNLLSGEMEYLQAADTLSIANPDDIRMIAFAADTFFVDKGYLELILDGNVQVALKRFYQLKDVLKKDSYGTASPASATESYGWLQTQGQVVKLISSEDRVFEKINKYYLSTAGSGFMLFNKKKVMQLFPQQEAVIKDYLKKNKVDFDSGNDLLRFAGFLQTL